METDRTETIERIKKVDLILGNRETLVLDENNYKRYKENLSIYLDEYRFYYQVPAWFGRSSDNEIISYERLKQMMGKTFKECFNFIISSGMAMRRSYYNVPFATEVDLNITKEKSLSYVIWFIETYLLDRFDINDYLNNVIKLHNKSLKGKIVTDKERHKLFNKYNKSDELSGINPYRHILMLDQFSPKHNIFIVLNLAHNNTINRTGVKMINQNECIEKLYNLLYEQK